MMRGRQLVAAGLVWLALGCVFAVFGEGGSRVLVVYEDTRFKKALVEKIQAALKDGGHKVVVATHSDDGFADVAASDFDAVFVTNSGVRSKVRPWVKTWLEKNSAQAAKIVLHTTQTKDWKVKPDVPVDAVTSASSMGEVDALAGEYVKRLMALLAAGEAQSDGDESTAESSDGPADE